MTREANYGRLLRNIVLGISTCAMALSALGGCSAFREQWPSRRFAREYNPTPEPPVVFAPDAAQALTNRVALNTLPSGLQSRFNTEHPEAAIAAVAQVPSGAGLMLYRITFMEDGTPSSVIYRANGDELNGAERSYISHPDDSGRPKAYFAPNNPATQEAAAEVVVAR